MDLQLYEQALFYLEILKVKGTSPKEIAAIRNRIDDALKTENSNNCLRHVIFYFWTRDRAYENKKIHN